MVEEGINAWGWICTHDQKKTNQIFAEISKKSVDQLTASKYVLRKIILRTEWKVTWFSLDRSQLFW